MIISCVTDEALDQAVRIVSSPDEDVFPARPGASAPIRRAFPRLVVLENDRPVFETVRLGHGPVFDVPTSVVTTGTLARWRFEHRLSGGTSVSDWMADRLRPVVAQAPTIPWIDRIFRGLERAAGVSLPLAFRGLARRLLEYPTYYSSLGAVAHRAGLSAGALQGRFLRRGLRSPSEHLRWLRLLAVAEGLADRELTLGAAADQFGYTSAGNLSRSVQNTTGKMPSELRNPISRLEVQTRFARDYLGRDACRGWVELTDLFWDMPAVKASEGLTA